MVHVFIRHKVKDYGAWRKVFDGFAEKRRAGGEVAFKIASVPGEPNHLCLFFEWQSVAKAKEFLGSGELAREMERAGVTEKPDIFIAEEVASGKP
jgi:quinol monooxygenase YgiN